jgi:alkylhydroperoxidase family enzyme
LNGGVDRPSIPAMSDFTIHTAASAPEASRDALGKLEANIGFVPNLAATIAESPTALHGFVGMQSSLRGTSVLTGVEREVVGITVSYANRSPYSMAAHSTFARGAGAGEDVVESLRSGAELPDPKLQALHTFTRELLSSSGHVSGLDAFLAAGYTRENALEVVTQVAYTTMANLAANLADTPVDPAFEHQTWTAAAV